MSEIENGYSWYKFHISGWLSSPEVQAMNFTEKGVYHHLLTIQARDGKLAADVNVLAKQAGMDTRTLKSWLKKWGCLMPIIDMSGDVLVTSPQRECNAHATSTLRPCNVCVASAQPLRCFAAASWMRGRSVRANPKQWNLSVKSGEFTGQPFLEENRGEGYIEGEIDGDQTHCRLTARVNEPTASKAVGRS